MAQVDPLLSLWQQPVVHKAALKAVGIAIASFTAAGTLSALLGKVARKVRCRASVSPQALLKMIVPSGR